jgi:hypothetical protein
VKEQLIRYGILSGLIAIFFTVGNGYAKIPEPDNIIYGVFPGGVDVISLQVNGDVITTYRRGEIPAAWDYFILRIPIDAVDPQDSGTARPGEEGNLFLDEETISEMAVVIGERGTVQQLFLAGADLDSDGDGPTDSKDNCLDTPNDDQDDVNDNGLGDACDPSDSDGDGYSDMLEYSYIASDHKDPAGKVYDLLVVNAPGDDGWVLKGDIDNSMTVDLVDAILALQVVTGSLPVETTVYIIGDVNDDGFIGLAEAVYALQEAAK